MPTATASSPEQAVADAAAPILPQSITLPALAKGERYAGIVIVDGRVSYHLILLPGELDSANWKKAGEWAKSIGGELPTRSEQALLYANLKAQFKPDWHWSGEQFAGYAGFAWVQTFASGGQGYGRKSLTGRARAVRRIEIQ